MKLLEGLTDEANTVHSFEKHDVDVTRLQWQKTSLPYQIKQHARQVFGYENTGVQYNIDAAVVGLTRNVSYLSETVFDERSLPCKTTNKCMSWLKIELPDEWHG